MQLVCDVFSYFEKFFQKWQPFGGGCFSPVSFLRQYEENLPEKETKTRIRHIVLFKFKEEAEGKTKAENVEATRQMLLALPKKRSDPGESRSCGDGWNQRRKRRPCPHLRFCLSRGLERVRRSSGSQGGRRLYASLAGEPYGHRPQRMTLVRMA